jgi:hypothetical protein
MQVHCRRHLHIWYSAASDGARQRIAETENRHLGRDPTDAGDLQAGPDLVWSVESRARPPTERANLIDDVKEQN